MAKLKSVDTIGDLNVQIAKLQKKRDKMVAHIKDYRGVGTYEGDEFIGTCYEQTSTKPMISKLKKHFGADWHKFLTKQTMTCFRVESKSKRKKQQRSKS